MIGPCMCGALDCSSCGPAQGSFRCSECGRYACDEHFPEFVCSGCGEKLDVDNKSDLSTCCNENIDEIEDDGNGTYADGPDPDDEMDRANDRAEDQEARRYRAGDDDD